MKKIIGIDLGTTNSLVCYWKDGKAELIPNAFGDYLTPSVVGFGEGDVVYVGKTAKERLVTHPDSTFEFFKRNMGTSTQYGKYTPEELSSFVLRSLKEDAEKYLGEEVEEAVISVPAYFNDKARNATKNAGILAGLKVERIINEPSAAALGYLRGEGNGKTDLYEDKTMLVFDFGGGTLDISLVETFENVVEIVSVSGDNRLGGIDFDRAIATYFLEKQEISEIDVTRDVYNLILESAEKAKRKLTDHKTTTMRVRSELVNGDIKLSNKELVNICKDVLKRIYKPIQEILHNSGKSIEDITDIVMVGGSSKMPVVKHYLERVLSREDIYLSNPDHLIAIGMGVYAGIKERDEVVKNVILTDVCPFSLGTSVYNEMNKNMPLSSFIIPRNTALPVSRMEKYRTVRENQTSVWIDVFQGENLYAKSNKSIGYVKVDFPMPAPKDTEVLVTFTYDLNGLLIVDVEIPEFDIKRQEVIVDEESSLTEDTIKDKLEMLNRIKLQARDEQEDSQILEWALKLYTQYSGDMRDELARRIEFFQHQIATEKDIYQKIRIRNHIKRFLLAYQMNLNQLLYGKVTMDDSWMEDDDKMIEDIFNDWNGSNDNDDESEE